MREDIAGPRGASSRPMWETLEGMVREKAQEFIQQIMEEEVTELLGREKSERRSTVDSAEGYRNGYGKPRRLAMSSGTITLRRPRVRGVEERFESRVLPLFARRTKELGALLPELYLHGLAEGDFELAMRGLLGEGAPLSKSSIRRLRAGWTAEFEEWSQPFLSRFLLVKFSWQGPVRFPTLREHMLDGQILRNLSLFGQGCLAVLLLNSLKDQPQPSFRQESVQRQSTESVFQVIVGRPHPGIGRLITQEPDHYPICIFRPASVELTDEVKRQPVVILGGRSAHHPPNKKTLQHPQGTASGCVRFGLDGQKGRSKSSHLHDAGAIVEHIFHVPSRTFLVTAIVRQVVVDFRDNILDRTISRYLPEHVEDLTGRNVIQCPRLEPVIQKCVDAWSEQTPLAKILPPPIVVKITPYVILAGFG